jgi:eukaryotic-like serine/threonine-protein kinase
MKPAIRILVVAEDNQVGRWLQLRVEASRDDCGIDIDTPVEFERRLATTGTRDFAILVAALDFSPATAAPAFAWLDHVQGIPDTPPLIVLAGNGDELTAVGALRRGVVDYLPRRLVTTELLAAAIESALATRRAPVRAATPASVAMADSSAADLGHRVPASISLHDPLKVPRDLIPRYMLLDTLGESARATVYLAHSAALDRHVALKVSRVSDNEDAQFSREFQTAGGLRHPGIIDIYDYGMHDGREFIAMEYFACGDLKARLLHPLSEHEALEYLRRIATGLSAVHQQGIVHRDLKPPNIMLREDGQVVLIDFGISRNLEHGTRSTAAGVLRGSPYYMSPEQAQGLELDARSDLYSLGVIFHEMLTGAKPYLGSTAIEVLQLHVSGAMPELPPELADHQLLLDGMMAKTPAERFASADDLLAILGQAAA